MKKNKKTIGGINRASFMLAAGYCTGLAYRETNDLREYDRKMLKRAGKAMYAAARELWPEWFK